MELCEYCQEVIVKLRFIFGKGPSSLGAGLVKSLQKQWFLKNAQIFFVDFMAEIG